MIKIIAFAVFLITTSQVKASSENCPNDHSLGYCILDFVGLARGAREVPAKDIAKLINENGNNENGSTKSAFDLASNGVYLMHAKSALDLALGGTMSIFGLLGNTTTVGQLPQFFIMLPENEVVDGNPLKTAEDAWIDGVTKALNIQVSTLNEIEKNPTFGSPYVLRNYTLKGGDCGEGGCVASAKFFNLPWVKSEVIDKPPTWLGNERLYIWAAYSNNAYPDVRRTDDKKWMFPPTVMPNLVKNLPKWFYFYSPGKVPFILTSENLMFFSR